MINCIVAVDKSQGIGINNQLPWPYLKSDMQWFKQLTTDNVVIMGSNTWRSIKKPLPNRINIVLSKSNENFQGCDHQFKDAKLALEYCLKNYPTKEIFIIGGESIYNQFMKTIDRFYVTEINEYFDCDKFFDLTWVKNNFTTVLEHGNFSEPISYSIKEYRI